MVEGLQIALCGQMRSGKDTVGEYLIKKYGFKRFAFGDGIVKTCKKLFPEEFESGVKPRGLLQDFGQYCVDKDVNVWVNYLFREMLYQEVDPVVDNVVITDLRQPHEYKKLVESGFTIIRVNATEEVRRARIEARGEVVNEKQFNHETERHIPTFVVDYELDNNTTYDALIEQVEVMMMNITGGMENGSW